MNRLSVKLGYWSAVILTVILTAGYIFGFAFTLLFVEIPQWTNLSDFVAAIQPAFLLYPTIAQVAAFLALPLLLIILFCLHEHVSGDKKILTGIGLCFAAMMAVLGCMYYFVHFNGVRLINAKADLAGLEQFIIYNPDSTIMAIGILGTSFFAGLAFLFFFPVFSGRRLEQWLRYTFLLSAICSFTGMFAFLFDYMPLMAVYLLGQLVGSLFMAILSIIFFKELADKPF